MQDKPTKLKLIEPKITTIEWERGDGTPSTLRQPTLDELLATQFPDRQYLLWPWLREQESCMVYAAAGVGKSLFALSAAIAVAGRGSFLGWNVGAKTNDGDWRVLYVDGEMHITDIQERARLLLDAVPDIDRSKVGANLSFLARQHQEPEAGFPSITETDGTGFILKTVREAPFDLIVLDNFSTLGQVEDENAASSFNSIQSFLMALKTDGVATVLVHHSGKERKDGGGDFRGSSKLAATFETIIKLERLRESKQAEYREAQFHVRWDKVRAGGRDRIIREVLAKLTREERDGAEKALWLYEEHFELLLDLKQQLSTGKFKNMSEIATYYDKSPPMGRKYIERGITVGLFTRDEVSHWFGKGKMLRNLGNTKAPVRPSTDWMDEADDDNKGDKIAL
jgi:KaiC/GvpD/RAD55 family RecA-like ATPase